MMSEDIYYDSWKDDRDIILEYNQVSMNDASVSNILGVGIDNLTQKQAVLKIIKMIEKGGVHHVLTLNPYKLIRFKANNDLNIIFNNASMKIATGSGLPWAARKLHAPLKERIHNMSFLMELIRVAEVKEYTIFIVGGQPEVAEGAFFNIKKSFPKIRIVGRHGGYFNLEREKSVIEAIRKSEADIVLVGMGFPREDRWIYKFKEEFKNTVFVSVGGSFDIISGTERKAPAYFMEKGSDWFYRIITKPWRLGRLIRLGFFYLHVSLKSLFSRN